MEMPQMNKGGKFIFGKSVIRKNGTIQFPLQAIEEYKIAGDTNYRQQENRRVLHYKKGIAYPSKLAHILNDKPALFEYTYKCGEFIKYKGHSYRRTEISSDGEIKLTDKIMSFLAIAPDMELLSI